MTTTQDPFNANILRRFNRIRLDDDEDRPATEPQIEQAMESSPVVEVQPMINATLVETIAPKRKRTKKAAQSIAPEDFVGPMPLVVIPLREVTATDTTNFNGYTIGIELTAMPNLSEKERSNFGESAANYLSRLVREVLRFKKQEFADADRDVKAVEVSTKPLKTWGSLKKFYDNVTNAFDRFGLMSHVEDTISGGGHIHVGNLPAPLAANILRDLQNRPYLNWVFNDPDDETTSSYATDLGNMSAKLKKLAPKVDLEVLSAFGNLDATGKSAILFYGSTNGIKYEWFPNDKRKMSRVKHHGYDDDDDSEYTLEFRFFQTPLNWEEQQAQLEFVLRYIEYVKAKAHGSDVVVTVDTVAKVKAFTEEASVVGFRTLLAELKLPEAPYERMLLENLPVWFERGERK